MPDPLKIEKVVNVISPSPPTWIRIRIIICPKTVNESTILIVDNPVTQVALITVKIISIKRISNFSAFGNDKRAVPIIPIEAKLNKKIKEGFSFLNCIT